MAVAYNNSMYTLDIPDCDWNYSKCKGCPYAEDSLCWKLGCIKEIE
ncbi:MAG: hypothetical protein IJH65_13830 [Methanobrevibacter sp.]|nr:hypothetical protein [Methanobrevibacter sp.]